MDSKAHTRGKYGCIESSLTSLTTLTGSATWGRLHLALMGSPDPACKSSSTLTHNSCRARARARGRFISNALIGRTGWFLSHR